MRLWQPLKRQLANVFLVRSRTVGHPSSRSAGPSCAPRPDTWAHFKAIEAFACNKFPHLLKDWRILSQPDVCYTASQTSSAYVCYHVEKLGKLFTSFLCYMIAGKLRSSSSSRQYIVKSFLLPFPPTHPSPLLPLRLKPLYFLTAHVRVARYRLRVPIWLSFCVCGPIAPFTSSYWPPLTFFFLGAFCDISRKPAQ